MIKVEKARLKHFEAVYRIVARLDSRYNSKSDWKRLFIDHFNSGETYYGYILLDNDEVVGFLGLIFAKRKIDGLETNFCNITSWIVEREYRSQSLSLLKPVLRLKDYIITTFTGSKTVSIILNTLKFKGLGDDLFIIVPLLTLSTFRVFNGRTRILFNRKTKRYLNVEEKRLYSDHSFPGSKCIHILFKESFDTCYIIAKRPVWKGIPFLQIHYISNVELFAKCIDALRVIAPLRFRVVSIMVDKRFLKGEKIRGAINYKLKSPRYYKSNLTNPTEDLDNIDHLYSEFMLLNI